MDSNLPAPSVVALRASNSGADGSERLRWLSTERGENIYLPQTSRESCGRHTRSREHFSTERTLESDQHIPKPVRLSVWHMPTPRACSGRHKYALIAKVSRKAVTRSYQAAASASSKSPNHPNPSSASVFNKTTALVANWA